MEKLCKLLALFSLFLIGVSFLSLINVNELQTHTGWFANTKLKVAAKCANGSENKKQFTCKNLTGGTKHRISLLY